MKKIFFVFANVIFSVCAFAQTRGWIENITAGENITAPAWVYINAGDGKAYKANATTTASPAAGIVFSNAVTNGAAQILFDGVFDWPAAAFTPGAIYYLSASTSGAMTTTAPANAQMVGLAVSAGKIMINIKPFQDNTLDESIYNSNGALSSNRVVDGNGKTLSITDAASVEFTTGFNFEVLADGNVSIGGDNIDLVGTANATLISTGSDAVVSSIAGNVNIDAALNLSILSDSVSISDVSDNFVGERTFLTISPGGFITKQEGISTEDITYLTKGRATGQTAANSSVATLTVGGSDATYEVSANVLVTTAGTENFNTNVVYTDEGNTSRTAKLNFSLTDGVLSPTIRFTNGAVPYMGIPLHIRCKASTSVTITTTGSFTGCTYNVDAVIKQQ